MIPKLAQHSNLTAEELKYISLCVEAEEALNKPLPLASKKAVYKYWLNKYGIALIGLLFNDSSDFDTNDEEDKKEEETNHKNTKKKKKEVKIQKLPTLGRMSRNGPSAHTDYLHTTLTEDGAHPKSTAPEKSHVKGKCTLGDVNELSSHNASETSTSAAHYPANIQCLHIDISNNSVNLDTPFLKTDTSYLDSRPTCERTIKVKTMARKINEKSNCPDVNAEELLAVTGSQEKDTNRSMQEDNILKKCDEATVSSPDSSFIISESRLKRQARKRMYIQCKYQGMDTSSVLHSPNIRCSNLLIPRPPSGLKGPKKPVWHRRLIFPKEFSQRSLIAVSDSLETQHFLDLRSMNNDIVNKRGSKSTSSDVDICNQINYNHEECIHFELIRAVPSSMRTVSESPQPHADKELSCDLKGDTFRKEDYSQRQKRTAEVSDANVVEPANDLDSANLHRHSTLSRDHDHEDTHTRIPTFEVTDKETISLTTTQTSRTSTLQLEDNETPNL